MYAGLANGKGELNSADIVQHQVWMAADALNDLSAALDYISSPKRPRIDVDELDRKLAELCCELDLISEKASLLRGENRGRGIGELILKRRTPPQAHAAG